MRLRCNECWNTKSFLTDATVNCVAIVNENGDFEWWQSENFENPNWSKEYYCEVCESEDVIDLDEEEEE